MNVARILKDKGRSVAVSTSNSSVRHIVETLAAERIGALVVCDKDRHVEGIISERDIVRELGKRGAACLAEPVESLMTAKIVSCSRTEGTDAVLGRMTDGRFRHMPVIEEGEMVGLISIGAVIFVGSTIWMLTLPIAS